MPELPEVETLCRQLNAVLPGKTVLAVDVLDSRLTPPDGLTGRQIGAITRHGKFLRIALAAARRGRGGPGRGNQPHAEAGDAGSVLVLHLRMTGRLLWQPPAVPLPRYARLAITFAEGRLVLADPRRFATIGDTLPPSAAVSVSAGRIVDPLAGAPAERLRALAQSRRLPVKAFLMDQRWIAGIGNIYACEILHQAGLDPRRPAGGLRIGEWRKVQRATAAVLARAVECRGTSISDWRDLFGEPGANQHHLEVYSRQGEPCRRCGARIERLVLGGRGTWFCPCCQK